MLPSIEKNPPCLPLYLLRCLVFSSILIIILSRYFHQKEEVTNPQENSSTDISTNDSSSPPTITPIPVSAGLPIELGKTSDNSAFIREVKVNQFDTYGY